MNRVPQHLVKKVKLYTLDNEEDWEEFLTGYLTLTEQEDSSIVRILVD